jgi:hypothetical protein
MAFVLMQLCPQAKVDQFEECVRAWLTPAFLDLLSAHAEMLTPCHVLHVPSKRKLECLKPTLTYAWRIRLGHRGLASPCSASMVLSRASD